MYFVMSLLWPLIMGGRPYGTVGITFRFSDDNRIRWLLLTEIEVCNEGNLFQ